MLHYKFNDNFKSIFAYDILARFCNYYGKAKVDIRPFGI